jgi:predicted negative regulator of RcsB-dependent stress response
MSALISDPSFRHNALREIIGGLILLAIVFAYQYWANTNLRDTGPTHEDLVKMFQKRVDRGDV